MNGELVLSEVYQLKQHPESVVQTTRFLKKCLEENESAVPRSALVYYLDEVTKYILNWIAKGENEALEQVAVELDNVLNSNPEFGEALQELSYKQKFGANLSFTYDLISPYLRSDLELKDYQKIMTGGKVEDRLRELLLAFFKEKRRLNINEISQLVEVYGYHSSEGNSLDQSTKKCIQRDLDRLTEMHMVRKVVESTRKVAYEATPRAYAYRDEVQKRQKGDGWQPSSSKAREEQKELWQQMYSVGKEFAGNSLKMWVMDSRCNIETGIRKLTDPRKEIDFHQIDRATASGSPYRVIFINFEDQNSPTKKKQNEQDKLISSLCENALLR